MKKLFYTTMLKCDIRNCYHVSKIIAQTKAKMVEMTYNVVELTLNNYLLISS